MKIYKTSKKKRDSYVYFGQNGRRHSITPDADGVTPENIALLHELDDKEVDARRREDYHIPHRLNEKAALSYNRDKEKIDLLADEKSDPLDLILQAIENDEKENLLQCLKHALHTLSDKQRQTVHKKFYERRTNVDIAAEEGVTEAAIRNRLKKIYANLRKKLEKKGQFDLTQFFA